MLASLSYEMMITFALTPRTSSSGWCPRLRRRSPRRSFRLLHNALLESEPSQTTGASYAHTKSRSGAAAVRGSYELAHVLVVSDTFCAPRPTAKREVAVVPTTSLWQIGTVQSLPAR